MWESIINASPYVVGLVCAAVGGALAIYNRPLLEKLCHAGCIMLAGVGIYIIAQQAGALPPLSIAAPQIYFEGMDASPRKNR